MKIDIFAHVMTRKCEEAVHKRVAEDKLRDMIGRKRIVGDVSKSLWDMDLRFSIMDRYEGLVQILTPTYLPLELIASPADAAYLAKLYNDEMAELVTKYPERFVAAVACLPMNNMDAALSEIDRAINQLGFRGILMHTPIHDLSVERRRAIDSQDILPIFEMMSGYDLPIWIHPYRAHSVADYTNEERSMYAISQIFGWPYETSVAMTRLVFSGVLDKYPNLKFITHHCGAMVPYFADRIASTYDYLDKATKAGITEKLTKPPIEYFRMFYNDTALYGNTPALMCAYSFFGAEHILFGTDFPYDAEFGEKFTRDTIAAIHRMSISEAERNSIFEGNAKRLLRLKVRGRDN